MTDRTIIEVALAAEDMAWLVERADDLDLDVSSAVRMLVRQARKGVIAAPPPNGVPDLEAERRRATELARQAAIAAKRAELERQLAELEGQASEDDGLEVSDALAEADEVIDLPRVTMSGPPGSLFVPTGVSRNTPRGYDKSDPRGSVARQNYAYLGFNGG